MQHREFGQFTLLDHMGKGSVASVYRAKDNRTGTTVAVKVFESSEERPPEVVRKLREREVRMLISVQHPNVVKYYESGSVGDSYYYTMEFVENSLLKRMRKGEDWELADRIHILRQTCNALQAIHHQGIVHRDVKPGNILLDEAPSGAIHVKVTDLGIAKHVSETDIVREQFPRRVPGTPKYLSPEQIRLRSVDGRADIFSLGVVAYELLSGQVPFSAETTEEFLEANIRQDPRPVHHVNADVPPFLSQLVEKMLAKDREERYDADTLARDLELTYQHLVSSAPLVEENNPDSIFYVLPAPEVPAEATAPSAAVRWRWAIAVALVLMGAAFGYALRPDFPKVRPEGEPIDLSSARTLSAAEALEEARELFGTDQRWRALALLRNLDPAGLEEPQLVRCKDLSRRLQNALARGPYEQATESLRLGRLTETEIVLQEMKQFFPEADLTRRLSAALEQRRELIEAEKLWRRRLDGLRELAEAGSFKEAFGTAAELLDQAASKERRTELQRIIVRSLNGWQAALLRAEPRPGQIEECAEMVERYLQRDWAADRLRDMRAELYFRLSRHYRRLGDVERELETLALIEERYGGTEFAHAAREARGRVFRDARLGAIDIESLSRRLRTDGFKGVAWFSQVPEGGEQRTSDGTLFMVQAGGRGERVNLRQTLRPLRSNPGFRLSVKFRMKVGEADAPKVCAAGMLMRDRQGNRVAIAFDGADYSVSRRWVRGGQVITGSSAVREAFGDEEGAWHLMEMRYEFDLSRLRVFLDGEPVAEHRVELDDCRVGVFVRVTGQGACEAEFRDIICGLP